MHDSKILQLLNEWFEDFTPSQINRQDLGLDLQSHMITTFAGLRRSGKTYYFYQTINELVESGIPRTNILYINLEDDRLFPISGDEIAKVLEVYRQNFIPNDSFPLFLFLDEVHTIPNWDRTVRRLYDRERNIKIFLTGSSSRLLSSEISSTLRGRTISKVIFPLHFSEFLDFKEVNPRIIKATPGQKAADQLQPFFKEYLIYGGLPQLVKEKKKTEILNDLFHSIIYRDVIGRNQIRQPQLLQNFLKILMQSMASRMSIGKIKKTLDSIGFKASKHTLFDYLAMLKEAFFVYENYIFSYNIKDQLQYPRKLYIIDNGFWTATAFRTDWNLGHLLENLVYRELIRQGKSVFYWYRQDMEVDFVVRENLYVTELINVCYDMSDEKTYQREVKGLLTAMKEFGCEKGIILSFNSSFEENINGSTIRCMPVWYYLFQQD